MKRIVVSLLFCIIILFLFNSCPELFKDKEYVIIINESDYTIDVFVDNEYENTVAPTITDKLALYTKIKYTLICRADPHIWGPIKITLKKGEPYKWVIKNPPEPTQFPMQI